MHLFRRAFSVLALLLFAAGAQAQSYTYHVYLDADLRDTTGCTVSGGGQTFAGADFRLTVTVTGTPPVVSARTLAACSGGSFSAPATLSAGYPVGLNNGLPLGAGAFADVIEMAVGRSLLPGVQPQVRVGFAAESASGSIDILYTSNGQVGGPPMTVGTPQLIPTLGFVGALLLALVLVGVALRTLKRNRALAQMLLLGAFFSAGLAAWAANFIADGQVGDWSNSSPIGNDPTGDPVPNLAATDIVAAFGADEASTLFFRLDVVDVENRPPVAVNDAYTTLEDTALTVPAPGVLANDSDPEGNPITAQLVTGPTRGTLTLNANGGFTYTPNANANGTDTFTYNAFDGQVPSQTPATVTITITPVNDVPVFTAGPNQTVLEDAGAQTVNPWATGVSDGDPEVTQTLTFNVTGNTNPALFSAGPAISPTGALTYTPAANANGTATITLTLSDDGGTANGGVDTSAPQSFTITVTAVNDAPSFTAGANQTVNEDAGAQTVTPWATAISAGPADESGQTLSFNITGNTNPALFSAAPAVSPTGTLTYTPAANAVGSATITLTLSDNGGTANGGIDTSTPQTFTITVTGINDAPVFTAGPNQTVLEDAGAQTVNPWATGIDDGDPEVTQTLTFNVTNNTNAALFSVAPAISPTGVLTYTPAPNANGSATITLTLSDNGGTANGGVDTSAPQNFTITVTAVNDAPSFTASNPPTVNEDAAAVSIPAWATFNPGPADESGQTVLGYTVSAVSNPALFAVAPAVANNGTLSYTLAANQNGSSTFTVRVQDSGGTANGGVDLSPTQTFTVTVTGVNDAPSFTAGPNQTVLEDAGAQTVNPWATAINDGDPEVTQTLTFNVTNNTNAALFSVAPAISPTGVLTYTPAPNANGTATITLTLSDNGGTANGGVDTSAPQNFTITVTAVNDAPSFTKGADQSVNEDAGPQTVNPWATAISPGPADEAAQTVSFNVTGNTNAGLFSTAPAISPTGVLTYTPAANTSGSATITLVAVDSGSGTPPNVNTSAAQTFVITVNAVNDAPVNTVPGAQNTGDTVPLVFSTANTNAISVADVDAAAGIVQMSFGTGAPANGTLTLANPGGVLSSLTGNGTELVIATGTLTALNTALNGPSGSLTYTPVAGTTATRTITVITNDQGNTGSGGAQIDTDLISVNVDAPPVVSSTPANGATIANNAAISVNFSESVNVIAGTTLSCGGGPNLITGGSTGAGVTTLNLTYTAPLPAGSCTLTVPAASVSDVDTIDPPNNPAANYSATFTVDAAPAVTTTTPTNGSTTANNVALQINFSEPVDATNAVTLSCGGGPNLITGGASGTAVSVLNPTYAGSLPSGACVLTVLAAAINDSDLADPPQNPVANTVVNFTVDAAPSVTGGAPANGASGLGTGTTVSYTFDEAVNATANAITLNCAGSITGVVSGSGTNTLTFTPSAALPANTACTATAVATEITDVDAFDPPNNLAANVVRTFNTDAAPSVTATNPANGAVNVPLTGVVTYTFSENVNFTAASFTYSCGAAVPFNVAGSGTNTATLTPTGLLPINTLCTVTALAAGITDTDAGDPPDNMAANVAISFTSVNDNPPSVATAEVQVGGSFTALPLAGGVGANSNTQIRLTFSEAVNPTGVWAQVLCTISGSRTVGSGLGVTVLDPVFVLSPSVNYTQGDSCTLTVFAAQVVDDDAIDPPDNMTANFVATFNVDAAPSVSSVLPGNGATNLANNSTITVNFSEPVNVAAGGVTLNCGAAVSFGAGLPATNVSSLVLTPTAALPEGATCNGSVVATLVTDVDAGDPPDQMLANFNWSFTTDAAPTVTTATPAAAAVVPTTQTITVNFSENVDLTSNAFTLNCGAAVPFTSVPALPATATNTITLTPTGGLPQGSSCTLTGVAAEISDSDANDPPNNLAANFVRSFTVDAQPAITSATAEVANVPTTLPLGVGQLVDGDSNLVINFSEAIDATAAAVTLECPVGSPRAFAGLPATNATSLTIDPTANLPGGTQCTLTVVASNITDNDAIDPPNALAANQVYTFDVRPEAVDDTYPVTRQLTLTAPVAAELDANDSLGTGTITGFGETLANANANAPGSLLDDGTNGTLRLNANGTFTFYPPANPAAASTDFFYTVTGGDTAQITFTYATTPAAELELVWFVDDNAAGTVCTGDNVGTQACPATTLAAVTAADTTNDTIYLIQGAYTGTHTLENGERVVGDGSSSTLGAITGIAPVTGSSFPAFGGTAPTLSCTGNCITLGTGNTLRGFTIGDSGAAGNDIFGNAFGTLTVAELTLTGSGTAMNLTTGTLNGNLLDINVNAGAGSLTLNTVGGTWSVTNQVDLTGTTAAFSIANMPAGGGVTLTGGLNSSLGNGSISLSNNASPVNLGNILLNTTGSMTVSGSTGLTTVTGGSITTPFNSLLVSNSALAITLGTMTSTGGAGPGLSATNYTGFITIASGSITNSNAGFPGVLLSGNAGTFSFGGSVAKVTAGRLIDISGGTGNVDFSGTLSCLTSCGTGAGVEGLRVTNRTGGTVNFSNATKTFSSTGANAAISLTNNAGSTINFTGGGLAITTTSGTGFNATGGATGISVTGTGNFIDTTSGIGLNVNATTIAAAGLTFQRINSGAGANVGISLDTTGNLGGLTVTGTGAAASGGTISGKTGADGSTTSGIGIYLNSTSNVSLARLQLNTFDNSAITGRNVNNFQLTDSVINGVIGNNTGQTEGAINFGVSNPGGINGLTGTGLIRNTKVSGSIEHNLEFYNQSGTLTLNIEGVNPVSEGANPNSAGDDTADCSVDSNSTTGGSDGILFEMQGTANATLVIDRCIFRDNRSQAIQIAANDSSVINATIDESFARRLTQGNEGFVLSNGNNGRLTARVTNNRINSFGGVGIFVGQTPGNANALAGGAIGLTALIQNNVVNSPITATNHSIIAFLTSTIGQVSRANISIDGNSIDHPANGGTTRPFLVDTPDINTTPDWTTTVINNVVTGVDPTFGATADVTARRGTACFDVRNNTVNGAFGLRVRQAAPATVQLEQGISGSPTPATVLDDNHPPATLTTALGTISVVGNATCLNPPT
ncbi:MAG: Ig-like domain-containing protein [Lysobacterales bacterium]